MELRSLEEIVIDFNRTVNSLIRRIEKKSRSDLEVSNLDRLRKRIQLLRSTMGERSLIEESHPFFIEYSEQIISRDENFFNNMDVRKEYIKHKKVINKQDEFIFSLSDSIKFHYNNANQREKDAAYMEVKKLFECCVEYCLHKKQ